MNRRDHVTGATRRRYENRTRYNDPLKATIEAIRRTLAEYGARGFTIEADGPGIIVVMASKPDGNIVGGRATIADYGNHAIAVMYAGAACIRALIEAKVSA